MEKARRLAEERGVEVEWVHADLLDYRPPRGAFDLVIVLYLHLPAAQRRRVLGRAAPALAPGGMLLVGHDLRNLTEGHGGPQNPDVLFSPADIEDDLMGLLIERSERVVRPVAVDGAEVNAIDALVRARRPVRGPDGLDSTGAHLG